MEVFEIEIGKLISFRRRLRKNGRAINRMVAAIKEFGFKIPVLARHRGEEIEVVDGELRLKAAWKLGMTAVPVIFCDEWSEAQVMAFRLLVHRSVNWAKWDDEQVALEFADLNALDFDLGLTGFDPFEIDKFLFPDAGPSSGKILDDLHRSAVTLPGDLWVEPGGHGHRVLCGDATSPEAVNRLLAESKPNLMVCDAPYGVSLDPNWREQAGLGKLRQTGIIPNDDRVDWLDAYRLFPGNVIYLWHAGLHTVEVAAGLQAAGFRIRAQIIWVKQHFALSRGDFSWQHEPCWYAVREGKTSSWCGDRKQSTVWEVGNLNPFGGSHEEPTGHGSQKPVELMRRPILNNTRQGEIVYDPFLGSGTTLIAAELTDRVCYGLEIDPHYVDVIITRWQELTGKKAVLEADGRTFDEIAEDRKQMQEVPSCLEQN